MLGQLRARVAGAQPLLDDLLGGHQAHHEQLDAGQRGAKLVQLRTVLDVAGQYEPPHARLPERGPDQAQVPDENRALRECRGGRGLHPAEPVEIDQCVGLPGRFQPLADLDRHGRLAGSHRSRQENRSGGRFRHPATIAREGNARPRSGR